MSKNLCIKIQVNCIDLFDYSSKIALQTLKVAVKVEVADFERKIAIFICQNLSLCVGLLTFLTKNWNVTSAFRSLLDLVFTVLVFAAFCWNVTPANTEGRLYLVFLSSLFGSGDISRYISTMALFLVQLFLNLKKRTIFLHVL